jgi:hypothetical protein
MTTLRMIRSGILPARQLCKGAPWIIKAVDLKEVSVRDEANARRKRPLPQDPNQKTMSFQ